MRIDSETLSRRYHDKKRNQNLQLVAENYDNICIISTAIYNAKIIVDNKYGEMIY